jgi:hypothetical protein
MFVQFELRLRQQQPHHPPKRRHSQPQQPSRECESERQPNDPALVLRSKELSHDE